jgi:hypothetical protein
MAGDENWVDVGSPEEPSGPPLRRIKTGNCELAISLKDWEIWRGFKCVQPRRRAAWP